MTKKEQIMATLEKMGYRPELDNDGDILLRYQMKSIFVLTGDEDDSYVSVMLPQFHEIEDGKETLVLAVCNKMTRELKLAKVYVDQTFKNVSASCEFYYANEESLEQNLRQSLQLLGVVRTVLRKNMDELSED
ncbi:MAG: YbjN domain-containing protein [Prevotellaceae bacterium]|nr:YbjN domain-containing protein [Prevotellaceae bacterium]